MARVITGAWKSSIDHTGTPSGPGGTSNPIEVSELITYLQIPRRLDDIQTLAEMMMRLNGAIASDSAFTPPHGASRPT